MSTPRLHLHNVQRNGNEEFLGSFADGPRGRVEAQEALKTARERDHFLENRIERELSNPHRVQGEEHRLEGLLTQHVRIERVFARDQVQQLVRIPGPDNATPSSMEEARELEGKRTEEYLRGHFNDHPITKSEASAHELAKGNPHEALDKAEGMAAQRQALANASARVAKLDALLPKVTDAKAASSADEWHPGMTDSVAVATGATATAHQQIQVRSRSQGLRF